MEPDRVLASLLNVVTMVLSVCVHEFAHAFAAYRLGDDTAARQGRLSLNPLVHADPVGTVILPALAPFLGFGTFGWGRPVPYVPTNLTRRFSMRGGEAIVAFAGPFANLVMGVLCAALLVGLGNLGVLAPSSPFTRLLTSMVGLNFMLLLFNLIPVPPLDGSKVMAWIFGRKADRPLDAIQESGALGIMLALALGSFVVAPLAYGMVSLVYRGLWAIFPA